MKKFGFSMLLIGIIALTSCSPRLEVRFKVLPGNVPAQTKAGFDNHVPAPVVAAGGYVYVQTGLDAKASVYGPYAVVPGSVLTVKDIPSGSYPRLALFYTSEKISVSGAGSGLPLAAENDAQFWQLAASEPVSGTLFHDSGAVTLFGDTKLARGRKTVLEASLIPVSSTIFSSQSLEQPLCTDTAGTVRKQFFRIDGGQSKSLYVMLSNDTVKGIMYAGTITLYAGDGSVVDTKTYNKKIAQDIPESAIFSLPVSGTAYLYIEYIAAGNTKLPLFFY